MMIRLCAATHTRCSPLPFRKRLAFHSFCALMRQRRGGWKVRQTCEMLSEVTFLFPPFIISYVSLYSVSKSSNICIHIKGNKASSWMFRTLSGLLRIDAGCVICTHLACLWQTLSMTHQGCAANRIACLYCYMMHIYDGHTQQLLPLLQILYRSINLYGQATEATHLTLSFPLVLEKAESPVLQKFLSSDQNFFIRAAQIVFFDWPRHSGPPFQ